MFFNNLSRRPTTPKYKNSDLTGFHWCGSFSIISSAKICAKLAIEKAKPVRLFVLFESF